MMKGLNTLVTIYDVAKKANCSAMTVSRVINNTGRISEKTRNRVLTIMKEMNYVPNTMARSLVLQETKVLSLLITDITNPFFTSLARGAEDTARRNGYRLLLANSDEKVDKERDYIDTVLSARVDGVLYAPAGDESIIHLQKLQIHNLPFVLVDREVPGVECDIVVGDSEKGARQLTEHLIKLGHRSIALINGTADVSTARHRKAGYIEALKLNGIEIREDIIFEIGYTKFNAGDVIDKLMHLSDKPTALFAANNFLALEAMRSLRDRGYRVPQDISVVCFDDLEANFVVEPFMTVAAQPAYEFGAIGMQVLIDRIQDLSGNKWRNIVLPSHIHYRKSAASPPSTVDEP